MSVINPEYNPAWQEVYDFHDKERTRLHAEIQAIVEASQKLHDSGQSYDAAERQALNKKRIELNEQFGAHNYACQTCLSRYQHKTVQDAAHWVFKNFDPNSFFSARRVEHIFNFESFKTIDEVNQAWSRANEICEQLEAEEKCSLPEGRPEGMDIFERNGNNTVGSAFYAFGKEELFPNGYIQLDKCKLFITIDKRPNEFHICFTQDAEMEQDGFWLQPNIERLATLMYRRALASQMQKSSTLKALPAPIANLATYVRGFLSTIMTQALAKTGSTEENIHPGQFHFYIHHPARRVLHNEIFNRIDMKFSLGSFHDPEFHHFTVIPAEIHRAYRATKEQTADATHKDIQNLPASVEKPEHRV